MDNIKELLKENLMFCGIDTASITKEDLIGTLEKKIDVIEIEGGETVVHAGDIGETLFLVLKGTLDVYLHTVDGTTKYINTIKNGDYFGEISVLTNTKRTADVRAVTDCVLGVLEKKDLWNLVQDAPCVAKNIMFGINTRLNNNHTELLRDVLRERENLITLNKTTEEQLNIKSQALEEAQLQLIQSEKMAALGQLVAGVAHEINNPLSFVKSNMNTMKKFFGKITELIDYYDSIEIPENSKAGIEEIKENIKYDYINTRLDKLVSSSVVGIERVSTIVNDLKSFSRIDKAAVSLEDINSALDITLDLIMYKYKDNVTIIKEYGEVPLVQCNMSKLNQVFMNVLINALQSIDEKGTVTIATYVHEGKLVIDISDTGKGMTDDQIKNIFNPFFTTKPVGEGTGLGLSVSIGIVKEHKGNITVRSVVGEGSTFTITLPLEVTI